MPPSIVDFRVRGFKEVSYPERYDEIITMKRLSVLGVGFMSREYHLLKDPQELRLFSQTFKRPGARYRLVP